MFRVLGFFTWTDAGGVAAVANPGGMMMVHAGYIRRRNVGTYKIAWGTLCDVGKLSYLGCAKVGTGILRWKDSLNKKVRDILGATLHGFRLYQRHTNRRVYS